MCVLINPPSLSVAGSIENFVSIVSTGSVGLSLLSDVVLAVDSLSLLDESLDCLVISSSVLGSIDEARDDNNTVNGRGEERGGARVEETEKGGGGGEGGGWRMEERREGWRTKSKKVNKTVSFIINTYTYTCTCRRWYIVYVMFTSFRMCFSGSRRGRALRFGFSPAHSGLDREALG